MLVRFAIDFSECKIIFAASVKIVDAIEDLYFEV